MLFNNTFDNLYDIELGCSFATVLLNYVYSKGRLYLRRHQRDWRWCDFRL